MQTTTVIRETTLRLFCIFTVLHAAKCSSGADEHEQHADGCSRGRRRRHRQNHGHGRGEPGEAGVPRQLAGTRACRRAWRRGAKAGWSA